MTGHFQDDGLGATDNDLLALAKIGSLALYPTAIVPASENRNAGKVLEQDPVSAHVVPVVVGVENGNQPTTGSPQVFQDGSCVARIDSSCLLIYIVKQQEDVIVGKSAECDYPHILRSGSGYDHRRNRSDQHERIPLDREKLHLPSPRLVLRASTPTCCRTARSCGSILALIRGAPQQKPKSFLTDAQIR